MDSDNTGCRSVNGHSSVPTLCVGASRTGWPRGGQRVAWRQGKDTGRDFRMDILSGIYILPPGEEETVTVITMRYFSVSGSFLPDVSTRVRLSK